MRAEVWLRRLWLWLPALILVLANLLALAFYRLNYAGESAGLERRLFDKEQQLATITAEREHLAYRVERAEVNQHEIEALYQDRLASRRQRLTQVTEEVKQLARQAGLVPQAINYPEEAIGQFALIERSFVFTVEGTYQQLRTFINFLELSPSFLILKEVTLSPASTGRSQLLINLELATLFAEEGTVEGAPAGAEAGVVPAVEVSP